MVQILGKKKCKETAKAERFFKERGVPIQSRSLEEKQLSEGEWKNIIDHYRPEELFDTDSKTFERRKMEYMEYDELEEMREDPSLIRTPIVRYKGKVTVGLAPDTWKEWLA
ncbi:MAG: arsenate reductase family protein [Spirochaetia bacterium]